MGFDIGVFIKVRPAAAGRASIEEEEGGLGVEEGGPNAGRAGRAGGAGSGCWSRAGTRETVHGDEPAGRVGGVTVRCATKRSERLWGDREGIVWIYELYLIFKQEESSARAQSARAVGAWA